MAHERASGINTKFSPRAAFCRGVSDPRRPRDRAPWPRPAVVPSKPPAPLMMGVDVGSIQTPLGIFCKTLHGGARWPPSTAQTLRGGQLGVRHRAISARWPLGGECTVQTLRGARIKTAHHADPALRKPKIYFTMLVCERPLPVVVYLQRASWFERTSNS